MKGFLNREDDNLCPVDVAETAELAILTARINIEAFWAVTPRLLVSNYQSIRRHAQEYFNLIRRLSATGDRPHASEELGLHLTADPSGRAVSGVGLRPLACCDYGFESRRGHGCIFCECCLLSGRGLCVRLITPPEDPNQMCCV